MGESPESFLVLFSFIAFMEIRLHRQIKWIIHLLTFHERCVRKGQQAAVLPNFVSGLLKIEKIKDIF